MLCAILIPSRARPDRLLKTIHSIYKTASLENFDIRLRLDLDDQLMMDRLKEFESLDNVRVYVGMRRLGYECLNEFYTELADMAPADWLMIMNDDAWIDGKGWDKQLADVPREGFIVQPEWYQWGQSVYKGECSAFPFVPNGCWKKFGLPIIPHEADASLHRLLVDSQGWKTHFLLGVRVVHERDSTEQLEIHRKL